MAGKVEVDGTVVTKAGTLVSAHTPLLVLDLGPVYVSRGGEKLAGAFASFMPLGLRIADKVAIDIGASTGGFTDCLLQSAARRVYAVDVGRGLLHEKLRTDSRVVVLERTNARQLTVEQLGERVQVAVVDVSFIGLAKLFGALKRVLRPEDGELVALIKPQFEAGRSEASRGKGVIRDDAVRKRVIDRAMQELRDACFDVVADAPCVLPGPKGNREHFVYARLRTC